MAAAQTVNFFVQKRLVFKSNAAFGKSVPKYIVPAVVLVILSAVLPAYSQAAFVSMEDESLMNRIFDRNGIHTLENAEAIGLGSRSYQLANMDH